MSLEILGRRLEHDVAALQLLERHDAADAARASPSTCASRDLLLRDEPLERLRIVVEALVDRLLLAVLEDHLVAGLGRDLGDARAHRAGADHADASSMLDELHAERDRLAAADAERRDAAPLAAILQRVQQRHQHARARAADRVAERRPRRRARSRGRAAMPCSFIAAIVTPEKASLIS